MVCVYVHEDTAWSRGFLHVQTPILYSTKCMKFNLNFNSFKYLIQHRATHLIQQYKQKDNNNNDDNNNNNNNNNNNKNNIFILFFTDSTS